MLHPEFGMALAQQELELLKGSGVSANVVASRNI